MDKFFRKTKGAISIFLVLVMLPMFTCAGLIVDGARISAARTSVTGAGDLAMNAALSEYDEILKDVYGLFAMSETTEELEANVSRYFSNTINNEGILQGSDSYTRSFINSIGSLFSSDDITFDNIVDTEVESFNLVEVSNSALANPTVLDRQIVEYMKYRGPVSLGTGLITKLGLIGETSKQTKALEAKVTYEKKLDTVQEACETAYSAINTFNDLVSGDSKYAASDYITKMSQDISKAKTKTQEMTEYIVALNSSALKVECLYKTSYGYKDLANILIANKPLSIFNLDSDVKKAVEKHYSDSKAENKAIDTMDHIETSLSGVITLLPLSDGTYDYAETDFTKALVKLDSYYETDLSKQITAITLHNNVPGMKRAFTYTLMYTYYYEMLSDEEKETYSAKNDAYSMLAQIMLASSEFCSGYRNEWESKANTKGREASELLYAWYSELSGIDTALTDAIDALDAVIEKVGELDSARTSWSNKVDALSDSDVKTSMQSDYQNSAKDMNEAAITALKTVLENNQTHFSKIKKKLDSIKYYDKNICISDSGSTNYYSRYSGKITKADVSSWSEISSTASSCMSNYKSADVTTGITPAKFSKITEDQQFYKYLKNVCATVEGESTEESTAKSQRKELINQGNADKSADVSGITSGSYITDSGLTSDISAAIDAFASGKDAGSNSFDPTAVDSEGDDDTMADNSKANLSAISSLLENLSNIGETARDKVYLEEYFTEMFSCYTTGKGSEDLMTLSNKDMSTNKFFGSEMEYILYGKDTVQANLNCSKASIFGVRFALNSIYALTSSDTRTPALTAATAIAGWTGFGVPIVQTVILLAWSMAESMVDVDNLCNGEAVVIYKSSDTWVLGLNGLKDVAKEAASKAVGDIFDKIENVAVDSIDSLTGEIEDYVSSTTKGMVESIQGSIMASVERLAVQIIGESNYNLQKADVAAKVDAMLNELSASAQGDGTAQEATRLAIEAIKTGTIVDSNLNTVTIRDHLVNQIYSAYSEAKEGLLTSVSSKVESMLNSVATTIESTINGAVTKVGDKLKQEVSQIISEGGDKVKEKVTSAIENYMGDLGGSGATTGSGTSLASGFSLTYKEYIKAFMMLSLISEDNETAMLKRCAELIQANVSQTNAKFDISKAFTMVEVNATVSIRTTFFDIPVTSGVDAEGNPTYDLDFSNIGSGRQEIKYVGILGY
jgi:hypothetical protein